MVKFKLIFNQTLMISSAILFGLGIEELVEFLMTGDKQLTWQWYIPLSIILCAFVCSVPSIIFIDDYSAGRVFMLKVVIHFICIFAAVSLFAKLFGWYDSFRGYLVAKSDEAKINEALDDMRDED